MRLTLATLLCGLACRAAAHGILTSPAARPNMNSGQGVKLTPFTSAKAIADVGCGGALNQDPGVQTPTQAFAPGAPISVSWQ